MLSQTVTPQKIVFVDNGSEDNSLSIAKSLLPSDVTRFIEITVGNTVCLGEARKIALDHVDTDYVAFLDVDDVWFPTKLEYQASLLNKTNVGLVYSSFEIISEHGSSIGTRKLMDGFPSIRGLLLRYDINMSSVVLNFKEMKKHGLTFNTNLKYCPDFELFLRVAITLRCYRDSRTLINYRKSDTSLTKNLTKIRGQEVRYSVLQIQRLIKYSPNLTTPATRLVLWICIHLLLLKSLSYDFRK